MKIANRFFLILFVSFLFVLQACHPPVKTNRDYQLLTAMDSIKHIYIPDSRVKLWISSYHDGTLSLWTDDKKVYDEANTIINKRFPEVKANIELLPETNQNSFISALVNNSVANLRTKPKHSAELATQALLGTPLRIFKKQGEWYLVQTPNRYIAWVDSAAIKEVSMQDVKTYKHAKKVVFSPVSGFSYAMPDVASQTISDLVMGCMLPVTASKNGFFKVEYPDKREAWVLQNQVIDLNNLAQQQFDIQKLTKTAKEFLGFPYLWGGTSSKAVDCSGFTSTVYLMNGIILQRDASQQTKYGKEITTSYSNEHFLPGDLLFFGRPATTTEKERVTHVALYLGNGEFIHASGKVRINSMDSSKTNFIKSYVPRFVRANRINGYIDGKGIEYLRNNSFYREILN